MSLNNKNNDNVEIDELNIKSHLNTSLELNRISVSEDLINRTLEAVRKQPDAESTKAAEDLNAESMHKKVIPWNRYVRGIAGIAAAGLIIFVGYSLMSNFPNMIGSKKSAETPMYDSGRGVDTARAPEAAKEYTAAPNNSEESAAGTAQVTAAASEATQDNQLKMDATASTEYTITAEGEQAATEFSTSAAQDQNNGAAVGGTYGTEAADAAADTETFAGEQALSFENICILTPEQLEKVTISSVEKGTAITLNDQIAIRNFYAIMDKYTFVPSETAAADQYYTVDLVSPEPGKASYTIWIGENVGVRYTDGDKVSEAAYDPTDYAAFKQDLDNFFEEYGK